MLNKYFLVGVRYDKTQDNGTQKKVTDYYLIDSLSFTESEGRAINELRDYTSGELEIASIKKSNISEVFLSDKEQDDKFFHVKAGFIQIDEKSGAEKITSSHFLVQASDLRRSITLFDEGMKSTMADYVIQSVTETSIMDVYQYKVEENEKA